MSTATIPVTTLDGLDAVRAAEGTSLGTSDWLLVDQARIDAFAEATGDHQWIHVERGSEPVIERGSEPVVVGVQTAMTVTVEVEGGDTPACVVEVLSRFLA